MTRLYILGFRKSITEPELVNIFKQYGIIQNITMVTDPLTGAGKGYGCVTMDDADGARNAVAALDGMLLDGRSISVRIAGEMSDCRATDIIAIEAYNGVDLNLGKRLGMPLGKKQQRGARRAESHLYYQLSPVFR